MKQTKHFKRTALSKSAKSWLGTLLLLIAMLVPQGAWAAACAKLPDSKTYEVMSVHYNGTASNYNGSADNDVLGSLKFRYWLDVFNYDGDNGYWAKDLTMKIDDETLTFYTDYACTTKVSAEYSTVLHGVWPVFDNSDEDHAIIGKNKSGSGKKAYFKTSSGLRGYIDIFSFYAASDKWTTMRVEVFIYDLYGHKVSVCGTYKRKGESDKAYNFVYYLGGCPRPKNVTTSRNTTTKQVTVSWQKETYSIPASDAAGETRRDAFSVIDNGKWGVYRNNNYNTSIQTVGNTVTSAADNSASCSSSPYTYNVCYEPIATYGSNSKSLTGSETSKRGLVGSSSITLNHVWGDSGSEKDPATCTTAAVHYQTCIYCSRTSDDNHTYTSGSALGHGSAGYDENYSWTGNAYNDASKDTKACTFTLTCKKCSTNVVDEKSLTCTKTEHDDAECTKTGSTTYQAKGSYTAANSAYNYSATKTNVYTVAALGHGSADYTESYSWTGNAYNDASKDTKKCTFTLTCNKCSTKVVNEASLTCTQTAHDDASCTETGSTTYQATGSYTSSNSTYNYSKTKTNEYPIAALGHGSTGYTPTYTWGETYDDATCTFTLKCNLCKNNVVSDQGLTTSKVDANHVDATCTKDGNERWTATGSYSKAGDAAYNGTAQVNDYAIPATHTFDDVTDPHHTLCTVCDHSFFRYTSSTQKAVNPNNADALLDAYGTKLEFTNTYVDGQGVMEFKGTLKTIGEEAFFQCFSFTGNLTIPNSVTSIGYYAFRGCTSLTGNLTIPNTVTSIGEDAFSGCENLTGNLTIPNSVTSIGNYAFYKCSRLTGDLTIPNSVTSIGNYAFFGCSGFKGNLTIPNSVTSIGNYAFQNCSGFKGNLTIPNSVTSIGTHAFYKCSSLTGVELNSVPQIGLETFFQVNCSKTVVLSDDSHVRKGSNPYFPTVASVTAPCSLDLTGSVVESHSNLTINHGESAVDEAVAATCTTTGLTEGTHCNLCNKPLVVQEVIPATGLHAFDDVTDPHHTLCTVCDHSFFRYTSSTKDVVNPNNADELKDAYDAKLDFTNTYVDGQGGVMEFDGTLKTIGKNAFMGCYSFTGDLIIPNSVTSIGDYAFLNCFGLKGNLTIPNSVTSIGDYAFQGCSGFTGNLTIPNSVTSIGKNTFYGCWGFNGNLTIPNSVTSIGDYAFQDCPKLKGDLIIPNSVTSIGEYAFLNCKSFTCIEFQSVPQTRSDAFSSVNCTKTVVLSDKSYVYKGSNPYFPEVASVTAPCSLDLAGSAVADHANLTRTGHSFTEESDADAYLASGATCGNDATYFYKCANCDEHGTETWAKAGTKSHNFAASDLTHDVCTVCNHGFLRYEANSQQNPSNLETLLDKDDNMLTIVSHTFNEDNNQGVMEFNAPLVTIREYAFTDDNQAFIKVTIPHTVSAIDQFAFVNRNVFEIILRSLPTLPIYNKPFYFGYWESKYDDEGNYLGDSFVRNDITPTIKLDDNSYVSSNFSGTAQSISYSRQMTNEWGTIVVPFAINYDADNTNYKLYQLTAASDDNLTFTEYEDGATIPAGTPMAVKAIGEKNGAGKYEITPTRASFAAIKTTITPTTTVGGLSMNGTYETKELDSDDYFISNNKFWSVGEMVNHGAIGVKSAPFRAYLRSTIAGAKARVLSINIADEDDDVTAVETLDAITEGDAEYYDMNGRRINSLQKGVNIVKYGNGKTIKVNIK